MRSAFTGNESNELISDGMLKVYVLRCMSFNPSETLANHFNFDTFFSYLILGSSAKKSKKRSAQKTVTVRRTKDAFTSVTKAVVRNGPNRIVSLNVQPKDIQYDLEKEKDIMMEMGNFLSLAVDIKVYLSTFFTAKNDIHKKPLIKEKILVSAVSQFAIG